jgi:hypothetical protein
MANTRVLWRRQQLIANSSALTAATPLGRFFGDTTHIVFPMFKG